MSKTSKTQQLLENYVELAAKDGNKFAMAQKRHDANEEEQFIIRYYLGEYQQSHYQQTLETAEECITEMREYASKGGLRAWRPVSYDFPVKQNS